MELKVLNLAALEKTPLKTDPYPYLVVDNILQPQQVTNVINDFPNVSLGGSLPLDNLDYGSGFKNLLADLRSDEFRQCVAKKLNMPLENRPVMITARGMVRKKDGRIHTDTKSKLVTVLVYLNDAWEHQGGRLRILRGQESLENYAEEVEPLAGRLILFKVTDNCWHGHFPHEGVRKSIQLNYVVDEAALKKHGIRHELSEKIKKFKQKLN